VISIETLRVDFEERVLKPKDGGQTIAATSEEPAVFSK
jgi:hypothetical protein